MENNDTTKHDEEDERLIEGVHQGQQEGCGAHLLHPRVDLLVWGVDQEVPLLVVLDERLHPEMNFNERSKATTMTLQQVHLETNCAERNENKKEEEEERVGEDLRLDGLAEGPPLHLGLEPHVGDLQAEAVPVHGGLV